MIEDRFSQIDQSEADSVQGSVRDGQSQEGSVDANGSRHRSRSQSPGVNIQIKFGLVSHVQIQLNVIFSRGKQFAVSGTPEYLLKTHAGLGSAD